MARHKKRKQDPSEARDDVSLETLHTLLNFYRIPVQEFDTWIAGQTCPILPNGKIGFFHWDVARFLAWKLNGIVPIWD